MVTWVSLQKGMWHVSNPSRNARYGIPTASKIKSGIETSYYTSLFQNKTLNLQAPNRMIIYTPMQRFGFSNFRKFQEFPMMNLGGINIFVGKNNSGKSTAVKALILILQNIKRRDSIYENTQGLLAPFLTSFSFSSDRLEHLYLGTFDTSLNDEATSKVMSFRFSVGHTDFYVELNGKSSKLASLAVSNEDAQIEYDYSFDESEEGGSVRCLFWISEAEANQIWDRLTKEQEDKANYTIDSVVYNRTAFIEKVTSEQQKIILPLERRDRNNSYSDVNRNEKACFFQTELHLKNRKITEDLETLIKNFEYIEAHNATHKVLLDSEDKNNFVAQTVHRYYGMRRDKQDPFVEKWMKKLDIGDSFTIEVVDGEAYKVYIHSGEKKTLLSYKGTGCIQVFTLLLNLSYIRYYYAEDYHNGKCFVFIEEPEQNMHPSLQSLLAELFYSVWKESKGNIHFVVETHSEYLVRKMQVIAAKAIDKGEYYTYEINNDIKVYYFPESRPPYAMKFDGNGHFERKFGEGFFDEAVKSYNTLIRIERGLL